MAESEEDEQNKAVKLSNIVIYKIQQGKVGELETKLLNDSFNKVKLNQINTAFKLTLYTVVRESKDRLVYLLKKQIPAEVYKKTFTRNDYILIAISNEDAFAICTGKAYLNILPFVDMDFSFHFAKAYLDPNNITQIKCRYLNGKTIRDDRYYHKSVPGLNRALCLQNIFFIVDEFQSTIAPLDENDYCILNKLSLKRKVKVKVKKFSLIFHISLCLQEILDLMNDLLNFKKKDTEEFKFLDIAKLIKKNELISDLDKELGNVLKDNNELDERGFSLCPNNEKWDKCEKVNLRKQNNEEILSTWLYQPRISDIIKTIEKSGNENPACFKLAFMANGKWSKYDNLINYVHGSVIQNKKLYFHVGKNWYSVDEKHIENIETSFNKLMDDKLMADDDEMCLPLPWKSKHSKQYEGTITPYHCISFCKDVLKKTDDEMDIQSIKDKFSDDVKSPPDALSTIIGQEEYKLYKQSLEEVDEGKYNEAYISLDTIWKKNTSRGPFPTFLVGDKILVKNVELFDIARISEQAVHLYHVKEGFGQKTRDAVSQIRTSASLLYNSAKTVPDQDVLGEWYDCVVQYKYKDKARSKQKEHQKETVKNKEKCTRLKQKEHQKETVENKEKCTRLKQKDHLKETVENKEKFIKLFGSKKIVYVYAFLDDRVSKVKSPGSQSEATCVTKSYIAMAELLWLEEAFEKYPDFHLKFCQIRKPWRSDEINLKFIEPKGITTETTDTTILKILTRLESVVLEDGKNIVNVERGTILVGGFFAFGSSSFNPWKKLDVKFTGEDGIDAGGLGREFMRLALRAIQALPLFRGPKNEKSIVFDYNCWSNDYYYKAGQMLAYFIVHRGPCPNFFSQSLYSALAEDLAPDEICNPKLVEMIQDASNEQDFRAAVVEAKDIITLAKSDDLISEFDPEKKTRLVESLTKFVVIEKFKKGLQTMKLVDEIQKNKQQWEQVFIFSQTSLTASQIENLFPVFLSKNKERKIKEKKTQKHWRKFLKALEGGDILHSNNKVHLEDLLVFATGADQVPLLSFTEKPRLSFRHNEDIQEKATVGFPVAVTCTMELMIPVLKDYRTFKWNMASAISMIHTFTNQ